MENKLYDYFNRGRKGVKKEPLKNEALSAGEFIGWIDSSGFI